uniref:Uncharacterized protein n=1 Tax=Peronospora matthiolae TaxID=2874970 RepID=A0AAV1V1X6_9STRA
MATSADRSAALRTRSKRGDKVGVGDGMGQSDTKKALGV